VTTASAAPPAAAAVDGAGTASAQR
jgi:hypothetical protein